MRLLIDTFNVLHVTGVLPPGLAGPGVAGLAALIQHSRWAETPVALVCDGMPPPKGPPRLPSGIRTIYSRQIEADDVLERLIADSSAPARLLVISSDRRVRRAAKKRGARELGSEEFLRLLLEDRDRSRQKPSGTSRPANLRPGEVDSWKNEFQIGEEEIDLSDEALPKELLDSLEAMTPPRKKSVKSPLQSTTKIGKPPDPGMLIPDDVLREAQQLLDDQTPQQPAKIQPLDAVSNEEPSTPPTSGESTRSEPDNGSDMPASLIEEAEAMLRQWFEKEEGK